MASNAFVIHGNYTETGKPILASDPHLSAQLPSNWHLSGIHINDFYIVGASAPGIYGIGMGKSNHFAFGMTCPLTDSSDLFKEQLNSD